MSQQNRFFNNKTYSAIDWANYFKPIYSNGILGILKPGETKVSAFEVLPDTGMSVSLGDGTIFVNGFQFEIVNEKISLSVTEVNPRVDRIIVKLDINAQTFTLYVKQGTSDTPPELERTENIYEMSIATLSVPGNTSAITDDMITDDRFNPELCGMSSFYGGNEYTLPPGTINMYAGNAIPYGWLLCDGSEISRAGYGQLFTAIGTIYGEGDGNTTFNLPDYRGLFVRGLDSGRGIDDNRVLGSRQQGTILRVRANEARLQVAEAINLDKTTGEGETSFPGDGGSTRDIWERSVRPENISANFIIKW